MSPSAQPIKPDSTTATLVQGTEYAINVGLKKVIVGLRVPDQPSCYNHIITGDSRGPLLPTESPPLRWEYFGCEEVLGLQQTAIAQIRIHNVCFPSKTSSLALNY